MNIFQFAANSPVTAVILAIITGATLVGVADAISRAFIRKR